MSKRLKIVANGKVFSAAPGEILLDAALYHGLDLPHECRAGQCGSCLVRILRGHTIGGETRQRCVVHACRARLFTDSEVRFDELPPVTRISGVLERLDRLGQDVFGICLKLDAPLHHLPGQYCRVKFRGFPTRCFSFTAPFVHSGRERALLIHAKVVRNGAVTSELGSRIRPAHRVSVEGPFGAAYYRPGEGQRLVLVSSGTGFAPIWAIAASVLAHQPQRSIHLVAGAKHLPSLYMVPALHRLASFPNKTCIVTTEEHQRRSEIVRHGTPLQYLPQLSATDLVYAAGSPSMVEAVGNAAQASGAAFYADPFTASAGLEPSWLEQAAELVRRAASRPGRSIQSPRPAA